MDNITVPVDNVVKNGLTINEYLLLYNIANGHVISGIIDTSVAQLAGLESKGFIRILENEVFLREKSSIFFAIDDDLFVEWLNTYPTMVKKRYGGKRALSPASPDTILGKRLAKKWKVVFKKDTEAQKRAIRVLELQVADMKRSGDMEYFVEAARWLNEGYHEKYSYLLDEERASSQYENEDYM